MRNCGCNPIQEPFEFPIIDSPSNDCISFENNNIEDLYELKCKVICEFYEILNKLECGIQPDLEFLLQEISLIYILNE